MKGKKVIIIASLLCVCAVIISGIICLNKTESKADSLIKSYIEPAVTDDLYYDDYYKGEIVSNKYGDLYYKEDGVIQENFTGVVTYTGNTYYFKDGSIDFDYCGMVKDKNRGIFIIKNGVRDTSDTEGFKWYKGKEYFFFRGRAFLGAKSLSGVYKHGAKYYKLVDSVIDETFNGITTFKGCELLMKKGVCDTTLCLEYQEKGKRYYIRNGKVDVCRSMFANEIFNKLADGHYNSSSIREIIDKYSLEVPKSIEQQMEKGRVITTSQLLPGDFIYVHKGPAIIEAAMYIGFNDVAFINPCEDYYYYLTLDEIIAKYGESAISCRSFFSRN